MTTIAPSNALLDVLANRRSTRVFDDQRPVDESALSAALEAARWAPSAANTQPWRMIVARRGTDTFSQISDALTGFNRVWAVTAGAFAAGYCSLATTGGLGPVVFRGERGGRSPVRVGAGGQRVLEHSPPVGHHDGRGVAEKEDAWPYGGRGSSLGAASTLGAGLSGADEATPRLRAAEAALRSAWERPGPSDGPRRPTGRCPRTGWRAFDSRCEGRWARRSRR